MTDTPKPEDDIHAVPSLQDDTSTQPMWRQVGPEAEALGVHNFRATTTRKQAWRDGLDSTVVALGARNVRQRVNADDPFVKQVTQGIMALTGQAGRWGEYQYDKEEHFDELVDGIPREFWPDILEQRTLEGAKISRRNIKKELERAQRIGMSNGSLALTSTAGMLLDVDLPLTLVSGGSFASAKVAGAAAYRARQAGLSMAASKRVAGVTAGLSGGAQAGALVGAGLALQSDTHDWMDATALMLTTTAFGGTLGAVAPGIAFNMQRAHTDFLRRVREGDETLWDTPAPAQEPTHAPITPETRPTQATDADIPADFGSQGDAQSLSAAANVVPATPIFPQLTDPVGMSTASKGWIMTARDRVISSGMRDQIKARAENFIDKLGASKLFTIPSGTNDWFKMVRSESSVLNMLALDVFESASGYVRGRTANAAQLRDMYSKSIMRHTAYLDRHMVDWANSQGYRGMSVGVTPFGVNRDVQAAFYREVQLYVNARNQGRAQPTPHKSVVDAADNIKAMGDEALGIMQGRPGQHAVDGSENLTTGSTYIPQRWFGSKIAGLITRGTVKRDVMVRAIGDGYINSGHITDRQLADAMASALVDRFVSRGAHIDDSMLSMFSRDGRNHLELGLRNSNLSETEIQGIMRRFDQEAAERGKSGSLKYRNEIDLSTAIPDTNMQLVDLLRPDLDNVLNAYTREAAGAAALARQGIRSKKDIEDIITAAQSEQRALVAAGKQEDIVDPEFLRAMFSDFNGGPQWGYAPLSGRVNKGVGNGIATAKAATSLSVLTFNGFAQMAETGVVMMATGLDNFMSRGIKPLFDRALREGNTALLSELERFGLTVGRDHDYMKPHLTLDDANLMPTDGHTIQTLTSRLRETVGKGNYIQGYTSLLNHTRAWQQRTMALGVGDKLMKMVRANDIAQFDVNGRAFRDLGFNSQDFYRLQDAMQHIEWEQGAFGPYVKAFNFHNWGDDVLVEDFLAGISRGVDQGVQRGVPGETSRWMHTEVGTLATHLKTFPMLAVQKQFVRNMSQADAQAYATVMAAFASAYGAMYLRDKAQGRDREPAELARAAVGYSNITGWMPMVYDPVISMLGMPELRMNTFGPHSSALEVPTLSTVNNLLRAPGGIANVLKGTDDWTDRQAVRQLPFTRLAEMGLRLGGINLIEAPKERPSPTRREPSSPEEVMRESITTELEIQ